MLRFLILSVYCKRVANLKCAYKNLVIVIIIIIIIIIIISSSSSSSSIIRCSVGSQGSMRRGVIRSYFLEWCTILAAHLTLAGAYVVNILEHHIAKSCNNQSLKLQRHATES